MSAVAPDATTAHAESFDESYWTNDSQYRKFADYEAALAALRDWHQGLFGLIAGDLPAPGRALDAGCGHGAVVHELLARGWDARGLDLSGWVIEQARRARPADAHRFAVGDADAPSPGENLDLVICLEVLEHVPDPVATLRALASRLAPGGRLIATTPNLRPLIPWWDPLTSDPTHISVHEPRWWRGACRRRRPRGAAGRHLCRRSRTVAAAPGACPLASPGPPRRPGRADRGRRALGRATGVVRVYRAVARRP